MLFLSSNHLLYPWHVTFAQGQTRSCRFRRLFDQAFACLRGRHGERANTATIAGFGPRPRAREAEVHVAGLQARRIACLSEYCWIYPDVCFAIFSVCMFFFLLFRKMWQVESQDLFSCCVKAICCVCLAVALQFVVPSLTRSFLQSCRPSLCEHGRERGRRISSRLTMTPSPGRHWMKSRGTTITSSTPLLPGLSRRVSFVALHRRRLCCLAACRQLATWWASKTNWVYLSQLLCQCVRMKWI